MIRARRGTLTLKPGFPCDATGNLFVNRQASTLAELGTANRWAAPEWRGRTLALR